MGAPDILARLSAAGVRLELDGSDLLARPRAALTDELRGLIKAHKPELLAALSSSAGLTQAEREKLLQLAARWEMDDDDVALVLRQCECGGEAVDGYRFTAAQAKAFWLAEAEIGLH
jgi:TubC N-terminal docking domain